MRGHAPRILDPTATVIHCSYRIEYAAHAAKKNMLKAIIKMILPREYICTPFEWEDAGPCARVKVRAWSVNSARMKAYDILQCENIQVREYEQ